MRRLFYIFLLLFLADCSLSYGARREKLPSDSLAAQKEQRSEKFYDSLQSRSDKRKFSKLIYDAIFVRSDTALSSGKVVDESELFEPFAGCRIGSIYIVRKNVFEDTRNWVNRTADNIHVVTKAGVIRRSLLFKEGEAVDPQLMVKNKQFLESMEFIYRADFELSPSPLDSTAVDVTVITQDQWTISADLRLDLTGPSSLDVFDANLAGWGNRLSIVTNFDPSRLAYGGNQFRYTIPNIMGSFFKGDFYIGKNFDYENAGAGVSKELILPTDYSTGANYLMQRNPQFLICDDTTVTVSNNLLEFSAIGTLEVEPLRSSVYLSGHFYDNRFVDRPAVAATVNPAYHNLRRTMFAMGAYREKFYTTTLIYGYGNNEYISAGYRAELVGGYSWEEFSDHYYLGANFSIANLSHKQNYIWGKISMGSFIDASTNKWNRITLSLAMNTFTPLMHMGRTKVRHFTGLSYIRGWGRMSGCDEMLIFTREHGLVGFGKYVTGTNRAILDLQTVFFTPWKPFGFQVTMFSYGSFGLIGDYYNLFKDEFYSSIGLGVRIKNSRLIFKAVQLRLGIFLGRGGWNDGSWAALSVQPTSRPYRFIPSPPDIVPYR